MASVGCNSKMLPIRDAIREATGLDVSEVTAWRFTTSGKNGVRLRHWSLGCRKLTTVDTVIRWMEEGAEHSGSRPAAKNRNAKRMRQIDRQLDSELS